MKKILLFVMITVQFISLVSAEITTGDKNILSLLPTTTDLPKWQPVGEPEHVVGDDLFQLINGGAEIYHEYGFKQAVTLGFKNSNKKSFNLEIYEMENPEASYGVFTFKTGPQGKDIPIGSDGILEDYYLNFWKGNFVVTVIGFDSEEETMTGILAAAKKVAEKIKFKHKKPGLIHKLPVDLKTKLKPKSLKYLRGNLALFNQYEFDTANIFGVREGIWAEYEEFHLLLLNYQEEKECQKWLKNAQAGFKDNRRFKNFSPSKDGFTALDGKSQQVSVHAFKNYIYVILAVENTNAKSISDIVRKNLQ